MFLKEEVEGNDFLTILEGKLQNDDKVKLQDLSLSDN